MFVGIQTIWTFCILANEVVRDHNNYNSVEKIVYRLQEMFEHNSIPNITQRSRSGYIVKMNKELNDIVLFHLKRTILTVDNLEVVPFNIKCVQYHAVSYSCYHVSFLPFSCTCTLKNVYVEPVMSI